MTTTKRRRERQEWNPDLGVLASKLTFLLQQELFDRLASAGYDDLNPRHGAVLAYLDEDGIRATDLAASRASTSSSWAAWSMSSRNLDTWSGARTQLTGERS